MDDHTIEMYDLVEQEGHPLVPGHPFDSLDTPVGPMLIEQEHGCILVTPVGWGRHEALRVACRVADTPGMGLVLRMRPLDGV